MPEVRRRSVARIAQTRCKVKMIDSSTMNDCPTARVRTSLPLRPALVSNASSKNFLEESRTANLESRATSQLEATCGSWPFRCLDGTGGAQS